MNIVPFNIKIQNSNRYDLSFFILSNNKFFLESIPVQLFEIFYKYFTNLLVRKKIVCSKKVSGKVSKKDSEFPEWIPDFPLYFFQPLCKASIFFQIDFLKTPSLIFLLFHFSLFYFKVISYLIWAWLHTLKTFFCDVEFKWSPNLMKLIFNWKEINVHWFNYSVHINLVFVLLRSFEKMAAHTIFLKPLVLTWQQTKNYSSF